MYYAFPPRLVKNMQIPALFSLLEQFRVLLLGLCFVLFCFPLKKLQWTKEDKEKIIFIVSYDKHT